MYAIYFDIDDQVYDLSQVSKDITSILSKYGFYSIGKTMFVNESEEATVTTILSIKDVFKEIPHLNKMAKHIRWFNVNEMCDLKSLSE